MHPLITEILDSLDEIAPNLFRRGRSEATTLIHDEFERLAAAYADTDDIGFLDEHTQLSHDNRERYLCVCRETRDSKRIFPSSLGLLLYDHCWLIYYCDDVAKTLPGISEPLGGYLSSCELVMEIEFDYAENVPPHKQEAFHRDFRKLVIAKSLFKVFVFRSRNLDECETTMQKLEAQIRCFDRYERMEHYLLSCWCSDAFRHRTFPD